MAPVVSGLAALIRARFPTLTGTQVMQRIESGRAHPPDGIRSSATARSMPWLRSAATDSAGRYRNELDPPGGGAGP